MWYVSSNRDETHYEDPDRFDVRRNPEHQAFGAGGRHFCLGAALARLELNVMFEQTLRRYPEIATAASRPGSSRASSTSSRRCRSRSGRVPPERRAPDAQCRLVQNVCAGLMSDSARITCRTALISARWVNACGKLPRWRPVTGSISSAYSPSGLAYPSSRSHSERARVELADLAQRRDQPERADQNVPSLPCRPSSVSSVR